MFEQLKLSRFLSAGGAGRLGVVVVCLMSWTGTARASWELDRSYDPELPEAKAGYLLKAEWNGTVYLQGTDYTDYWNQVSWRRFLVKVDASGTLDEAWQFPFRPDTVVYHDFTADGRMTVGGAMQAVDGGEEYWLVRLRGDGSFDSASGAVNAARPGRQVGVQPMEDGRYLVYDHPGFTMQKDAIHLQRYKADLTPDESFTPPAIDVGEMWFPAYFVREVEGGLLLGFNWRSELVTIDGVPAKSLHRLTSGGAIDPAFVPYSDRLDLPGYTARSFLVSDVKDGIALVSTDWADDSGESPHIVRLRKLNAKTGAVDAAFQPEVRLEDGFAWGFLVEDGKVRVTVSGAESVIVNGAALPDGQQVFQLNPDGSLDTGFVPGGPLLPDPVVRGPVPGGNGALRSIDSHRLHFLTDGRVIVTEGGDTFTEVNGIPKAGIALLNPDGSVDPDFAPVPGFPPDVDHESTVSELSTGDLLLTGNFVSVDGVPRLSGVARLKRSGGSGQTPVNYAKWAATHGVPETPDAARDSDGDGVPDVVEYVFNLNPRIVDSGSVLQPAGTAGLPRVALIPAGGADRLQVEFLRRAQSETETITPVVEFSSDPAGGWQAAGNPVRVEPVGTALERVVVEDTADTGTAGRRFARVRVRVIQ